MPLSPEEHQELAGLVAQYGMPGAAPEVLREGLFARTGKTIADLPSSVAQGLAGSAVGLRNILAGNNEVQPWQVPKPFDITPAQTFGEKAVDFGGNLASFVGQAALPGSLVGKAGALAGMGRFAPIAGDIAAGISTGIQHSPQDAAIGGGEFAALGAARFLPWYARLAANAAVPVAGQLARGIDPTTPEAMTGTAAQMLFGQIGKRVPFRDEPVTTPGPTPPSFTMGEGAAPRWTGNNVGGEIVPYAGGLQHVGPGHGFTFEGQPYTPEDVHVDIEGQAPQVARSIFRREQPLLNGGELSDLEMAYRQAQTSHAAGEMSDADFAAVRDRFGAAYEAHLQGPRLLNPPSAIINPIEFSPSREFTMPGYEAPVGPVLEGPRLLSGGMNRASGESGSTTLPILAHAAGGAAGGLIGYTEGDTPEERATHALLGAAMGAGAPLLARGAVNATRSLLNRSGIRPEFQESGAVGSGMNRKGQAWAPKPEMRSAYDDLVSETGYPAVSIGDIAAKSGMPLDKVHAELLAANKAGKIVLSLGDFSLSDKTTQEGALMHGGDRYLNVRFLPEAGKPVTGIPVTETGSTALPILAHGAGATAGGLLGYAEGTDPEDKAQRALIGAAIGGASPLLMRGIAEGARSIFNKSGVRPEFQESGSLFGGINRAGKAWEEAAGRNERGSSSILDKVARDAEVLTGRGISEQVKLAGQKGEGFAALEAGRAEEAVSLLAKAPAPEKQAVRDYLLSPRTAADKTLLRSAASPEVAKAAETIEAVKGDIQGANFDANKGTPSRQEVFKDTPLNPRGTWQGRFYQAFVNPKKWDTHVGPKRDALVSEMAQDPDWQGYDSQQLSAALDEYGAAIRRGDAVAGTAGGATHKLDRTLTMSRKDLSPGQWEFLDKLRGDSRLTASEKYGLSDIYNAERFQSSDQEFLRSLSNDTKRFTEPERLILSDIAKEKVLTKAQREYLGEITDPIEREILSVQKLAHGAASAKTIAHLRDTEVDGRKLILTTEEHTAQKMAAEANGDDELLSKLEGYQRAPDRPGLGSIAGQWVDRQVLDALNAQQRVTSPWMGSLSQLNKIMKNVMTIPNPGTHARNALQIPLMAMIGRVAPWELGAGWRAIRDAGTKDEMISRGIVAVNFAKQELAAKAANLQDLFNPTKTSEMLKLPAKAWRKVQEVYGLSDDLVRASVYMKQKKLGLARGLSAEEAADKATTFVNRYTMNFGGVSPLVSKLRNVPFVSPFISYNAEMLRILKNLGEDALKGSGEDKAWAVGNLAQLLAMPLVASAVGAATLNGKDRDEWEKLKSIEPSFQRHMLKMPLSREKDGSFRYFSFGPDLPAGDFAAMIRDVARGDFSALFQENPAIGINKTPVYNQIAAQISGEDPVTRQSVKTPTERITRLLQSVTPTLTPFIGAEAQRWGRSFTENEDGSMGITDQRSGRRDTPADALRGLIGQRTSSENPATLLRTKVAEMNEELSQASREARRILGSNASQPVKEKAQRTLLKRQEEIRAEYAPILKRL